MITELTDMEVQFKPIIFILTKTVEHDAALVKAIESMEASFVSLDQVNIQVEVMRQKLIEEINRRDEEMENPGEEE